MEEQAAESRAVRKRHRKLAERIVGDSSIRDGLDDEQARRLIDWGLRRAKAAAQRMAEMNDEEAEQELERQSEGLRRTMRRVNRLASRKDLPEDVRPGEVARLIAELENPDATASESPAKKRAEQMTSRVQKLDEDETFEALMSLLADGDEEAE